MSKHSNFEAQANADSFEAPPFVTQGDLIEAHLAAVRGWIREAHEELRALAADQRLSAPRSSARALGDGLLRVRCSASSGADFGLLRLFSRFACDPQDIQVLWVLLAHELCPISRSLIRELATEQTSDPTTDAVRRVVFGADRSLRAWHAFDADGDLRRWGLIERTDGTGDVPEHRQTWRVARRVLGLAYGDRGIDPKLCRIARMPSERVGTDALELGDGVLDAARRAFSRDGITMIVGKSGTGRRSLACALVGESKKGVLVVDARLIGKSLDEARAQLRCVATEARFFDVVPVISNVESLEPVGDIPDRISLLESELTCRVLATSTKVIARRWRCPAVTIAMGELTSGQVAKLWKRALQTVTDGEAKNLASLYPLAPAFIDAAGRASIAHSGSDPLNEEHVEAGLFSVLDDRLAGLATRVTVTQTWTDVVLATEQRHAVSELIARIRDRQTVHETWGFANKVGKGLGVAALFSGPPGTGKTMIAGLVAKSLRIALYQVDISKIVSKWIGETEKNLAALFDAAEAGHAVLLFDEADAMFGKRTEVRSSNDRHANQETNYLLTRLESFRGICILTTNHEAAIDEAFRRRLAIHVRFAMPEREERERLWRAMLPESAPREGDLGIEELADTFIMSGGYIKNAVLRAAFLAADEEGVIDARRLARAAHLEYEAIGKIAATRVR